MLFKKKRLEYTPFVCGTCHPENPDYAALRGRNIWFSSRELTTTMSASPGTSGPEVNQEHANNALVLLGVMFGSYGEPWLRHQAVGYLVPDALGNVIVAVQGAPVDQLTRSAARRALTKISGATPVRVDMLFPCSGDPTVDRPLIKVLKSRKTRDLPGAWV